MVEVVDEVAGEDGPQMYTGARFAVCPRHRVAQAAGKLLQRLCKLLRSPLDEERNLFQGFRSVNIIYQLACLFVGYQPRIHAKKIR